MLSLRDFVHLPQVDPLIEQFSHEGPGLILVAGMDPREHIKSNTATRFIPSGRAGIFRILVRHILEENPQLQATVLSNNRETIRIPRNLRRRVGFELVDSATGYADLLPAIAHLHSGLIVIDLLTSENAAIVLDAAQKGAWIISQMDTIFRGVKVAHALLEWGIPRGRLSGIRGIIAMQRIPMLCECKRKMLPDPVLVEAICRRYPYLNIDPDFEYSFPTACETCQQTGRHNEITAFDFYLANPDLPSKHESVLSLEGYMLGLAEQGLIPINDLLHIESDQLHRTYHLLTASEQALSNAKITLERKIIELETANRVLHNRTEELVSLQEIGQTLIGTSTLRDLARQICRRASNLCGADRAIFYYLRDDSHADVLATHGWAPGRVPQRVRAQNVCEPSMGPAPSRFSQWPPGVEPLHADVEGARLKAGLRVPLITQGVPVGAMIVHSTTKARFQPGAVALLQTFANQSAIAIQRTGLIESLQEKIAQLEAAQEGLAQKERMEHELDLARDVQQAVLPQTFPKIKGYTFSAHNEPARQVGGDFYDVIDLGQGRFGLVVADVSDKGMPAAVYMALTRSLILAEARRESSPVAVLQSVNEMLRELGRARMFVTVFYGIVDGPSRKMTYARAGHDRPLIIRGSHIQELAGDGVFLGFFGSEHLYLIEDTIELKPSDRLILYTDGLTDTTSPMGQRFGRDGLINLLKDVGDLSANELCGAIFAALLAFQENAEQFDDMTLLVVELDPNFPVLSSGEGRRIVSFCPINELAARAIVTWSYEPPFDIYNLEDTEETIQYLVDRKNNFHIMGDQNKQLIGFCSFGEDGQVPGGNYDKLALDIGMGIHPDLTGQGFGSNYVAEVLMFAQQEFAPKCFRVTIADFNQRAQSVWQKNGFHHTQTFNHRSSNRKFVVMEK